VTGILGHRHPTGHVVAVIGVQRMVSAPPEAVWEVLADGWVYTGWVVGASRMRSVDPAWPVPDARLHHSVGGWPLHHRPAVSAPRADQPAHLPIEVFPCGGGLRGGFAPPSPMVCRR